MNPGNGGVQAGQACTIVSLPPEVNRNEWFFHHFVKGIDPKNEAIQRPYPYPFFLQFQAMNPQRTTGSRDSQESCMSRLTHEHRHELRNVFSVILANAEMLRELATMDGPNLKRLDRIVGACQRGEALLNQLREDQGNAPGSSTEPGACLPQQHQVPPRVLVVDDEADVVEIIRYCLNKEGFAVQGLVNSLQAQTLLQEDHYCCDLLITDLDMPELPGEQLCALAQQVRPELPVILISGFERVDLGVDQSAPGCREVLLKPFSREDLLAMVNRLLPA